MNPAWFGVMVLFGMGWCFAYTANSMTGKERKFSIACSIISGAGAISVVVGILP